MKNSPINMFFNTMMFKKITQIKPPRYEVLNGMCVTAWVKRKHDITGGRCLGKHTLGRYYSAIRGKLLIWEQLFANVSGSRPERERKRQQEAAV